MLSQVITGLVVVISVVQANDSFKNLGSFYIQPGYALEGHVIKTLPQFKADCMVKCKETLSCFSINTYKDKRDRSMCDLNRSTKKQSPQSFVRREGYSYSEPSKGEFCVENDCPTKQALPDHWYEFNSSSYKYVNNVLTNWDDAQKHCQTLGGELASFHSKNENEFVFETMLYDLNVTVEDTSGELASLKFDGSDASLRLLGAQLDTKDSKPALYTNETSHAEMPQFKLSDTDFTFAVSIFPSELLPLQKLLEGFYQGFSSFYFAFGSSSSTKGISLGTESRDWFSIIKITLSGIQANKWNHIAITRKLDSGNTEFKVYYDGQESTTTASSSGSFFEVDSNYHIGEGIQGWLSDMLVVPRILTLQEISDLADNGVIAPSPQTKTLQGAWIGLNDIAAEGTVQWSDGLPLTYKPNDDLVNSEQNDCGLFIKMNGGVGAWKNEMCRANATYVCKKKH